MSIVWHPSPPTCRDGRSQAEGHSPDPRAEAPGSGEQTPEIGVDSLSGIRRPTLRDPEWPYPGSGVGALRDPETKDPEKDPIKDPSKGSDRALTSAAVETSPPTLRRIDRQATPAPPLQGQATQSQPPFELRPPDPPAKRRGSGKGVPALGSPRGTTNADRFRRYRVAAEAGFLEGTGCQIVAPDIRTGNDQFVRTLMAFALDPQTGKQLEGESVLAWIRAKMAEYSREHPSPEYLYHRFATWIAQRAGGAQVTTPQRIAPRHYGAQPFFHDEQPPSPPRDGTTG